ncbi:hypothetical protein A2U01_0070444, partial [Trifolium medium]|nr:hypothetical protein [Trifolium medium]
MLKLFGQDAKQGARVVDQEHILFSYEAENEDLVRLKKSFIGVVLQPEMSYNIQNAFHSQGYFGVK